MSTHLPVYIDLEVHCQKEQACVLRRPQAMRSKEGESTRKARTTRAQGPSGLSRSSSRREGSP
eukprot:4325610-Alexandrium_andersonii.AAC.1